MEGVGQLAHSLFGLRLEAEPALPGEVWHPDVVKVAVYTTEFQLENESENNALPCEARYAIAPGTQIGTVFCDFFNRPNKLLMVSLPSFFPSGDHDLFYFNISFVGLPLYRARWASNREYHVRVLFAIPKPNCGAAAQSRSKSS